MTNEEVFGGYECGDMLLAVTARLVTVVVTWQFLL